MPTSRINHVHRSNNNHDNSSHNDTAVYFPFFGLSILQHHVRYCLGITPAWHHDQGCHVRSCHAGKTRELRLVLLSSSSSSGSVKMTVTRKSGCPPPCLRVCRYVLSWVVLSKSQFLRRPCLYLSLSLSLSLLAFHRHDQGPKGLGRTNRASRHQTLHKPELLNSSPVVCVAPASVHNAGSVLCESCTGLGFR